MKLKSCHTVLLTAVLFALIVPVSASAQDYILALETDTPSKDPVKQDETVSATETPEIRTNRSSTPVVQETVVIRDSELKTAKPVLKPVERVQKEEEKVQKEEEDPLSFNFLYYIIEKFKLSDIE